jgi:hypothetical protein
LDHLKLNCFIHTDDEEVEEHELLEDNINGDDLLAYSIVDDGVFFLLLQFWMMVVVIIASGLTNIQLSTLKRKFENSNTDPCFEDEESSDDEGNLLDGDDSDDEDCSENEDGDRLYNLEELFEALDANQDNKTNEWFPGFISNVNKGKGDGMCNKVSIRYDDGVEEKDVLPTTDRITVLNKGNTCVHTFKAGDDVEGHFQAHENVKN